MFELIEHIKSLGTMIVLVEQNVQNALEIADYAYVFENGRMSTEGPASSLINDEALVNAFMGI